MLHADSSSSSDEETESLFPSRTGRKNKKVQHSSSTPVDIRSNKTSEDVQRNFSVPANSVLDGDGERRDSLVTSSLNVLSTRLDNESGSSFHGLQQVSHRESQAGSRRGSQAGSPRRGSQAGSHQGSRQVSPAPDEFGDYIVVVSKGVGSKGRCVCECVLIFVYVCACTSKLCIVSCINLLS